MKVLIVMLLICMISSQTRAQIFGSFFSQKKENRKLLGQQIIALEAYKKILKTGYNVVSNGVKFINKMKSGEFDLHRDFFAAINMVNPKIRKYGKVAEIMTLNISAVEKLMNIRKLSNSDVFSLWENQYIRQVVQNTLNILANTIDELIAITTDNQLSFKDDERINRIDRLYDDTVELFSFVQFYRGEISFAKKLKEKQRIEIESSRTLNGVAN